MTVLDHDSVRTEQPTPPTPPAPRTRSTRPVRPGGLDETISLASSTLGMVSVLALWAVLQLVFLGGLSQARSQHLLYQDLREQLAVATAPTGPVPAGRPVALLSVARLGLQQVVVEGTASGDLLAGPGHRRDSVLPGQAGTSLVYGRASTFGAPFRDLGALRKGDQVVAQTAQGRTVFVVDGVRRDGDPLPAPAGPTQARIVLVSSEGGGLVSSRSAGTVYVDATAAKAFAAPAVARAAVPPSETAMATDPGAWPLLSLGLTLLLALTAAVTWARSRWRASLIWVIASPLALALAWFTTTTVVRLLPNLL